MPKSELARAKELVDTFIVNNKSRTRGKKRPLKRCWLAAKLLYAQGKEKPKSSVTNLRSRSEAAKLG
jgi:hypothetical protein